MTTTNPIRAAVVAEINFHEVLRALTEFSEKYPIERVSAAQIEQINKAAHTLLQRMNPIETATEAEIQSILDKGGVAR